MDKSPNIQNSLKEFYDVAKDKLLTLKKEVENSTKEHELQKRKNQKYKFEYQNLIMESEELDLRIKGLIEKLRIATKNKNSLESQKKEISNNIGNLDKEINYLKVETNDKVKRKQNIANSIENAKENRIKSINERLKKETKYNEELNEKTKEIENKIKDILAKINESSISESKKNELLLKDAAEMNKFLSEL